MKRHKLGCDCGPCDALDREFLRPAAFAGFAAVLIFGLVVARSGVVSWLMGWFL